MFGMGGPPPTGPPPTGAPPTGAPPPGLFARPPPGGATAAPPPSSMPSGAPPAAMFNPMGGPPPPMPMLGRGPPPSMSGPPPSMIGPPPTSSGPPPPFKAALPPLPATAASTVLRGPPAREKPQRTVYVNHLVEKGVNVEMLKVELRELFEKADCGGAVLDVHAVKHYRTRGQAWVIFDSIEAAGRAIDKLNGHMFHGRPMQLNFSKRKSDLVAREDGTYVPRQKKRKRGTDSVSGDADASTSDHAGFSGHNDGSAHMPSTAAVKAPPKHVEHVAPNRKLFAQDLPEECTKEALEELYKGMAGFLEVRFIAARHVAFIEFDSIPAASYALSSTRKHRMSANHRLRVNFAKQ